MSTYDTLRHFADSWGLLFLFGVFLFAVWRALRPSARAHMEEARTIPLRDEEPGQ
ncbi:MULTISPECIES: cbb3-type cytochrome c oxidase subunit 3 [unclassified Sphingosinithalassobacter]|uniref:cbb3-type cytochrome c oxidase subunit 3 n=1 Tax=unclassified Sphingosinithalassobacter TaxID=2676235 RepID=UPI00165D65E4|nr:cbb3-type cytochrome c oxidase subunit 3 [Sphingosinithalassobacter sp. CS137]